MTNYFEGHKQYFESIPQQKRNPYLIEILQNPHQNGIPYDFSQQYAHEAQFQYKDKNIHYYHTKIIDQPKALIFYIHGLYSYGGAYAYFGNNVANNLQSVIAYAIDFLNFGKSEAEFKGYMQSFQSILLQAQQFIKHIIQKFEKNQKRPKVFLVGHSFGGTIAFRMSLRKVNKYDGVIFLVPALRQIKEYQFIMKKIGKFIGYVFPKLKLNSQKYDDYRYSGTPPYVNNNLFYNGKNIAGSITVLLTAIEQTQYEFEKFDSPYILFQAGADKLVDIFAPLDLQKKCKSEDKTTIYMKGMWHGIFYEKEIINIMQMCINWLKQRI